MDFSIKFSLAFYTISILFLILFAIDIKVTWAAKHRDNWVSRIIRDMVFFVSIITMSTLWSIFTYYFHDY